MALYFFWKLARLRKSLIKAEETVEQLLLVTGFVVMCFLRDIIGQVATTSSHSDVTIGRIAELGQEAFSLYHLINPGAEILPYKVAMCMDSPIQLTILLFYCKNKGFDLDTSDMNASAVKQANYRRRQVVQGYIDQLQHAGGKAFSESENSQALVTFFILCPDYENEHKSEPTEEDVREGDDDLREQ